MSLAGFKIGDKVLVQRICSPYDWMPGELVNITNDLYPMVVRCKDYKHLHGF